MKFRFDSSQEYQLDAIRSVIDVFEGQPLADHNTAIPNSRSTSLGLSLSAIANQLLLSDEQILQNLNAVREKNSMEALDRLEACTFRNTETGLIETLPFNLTIEMETGTGKTYTYLRTIYELSERYGFKKFVIVVPSVAIREGVNKNRQITHDHLQELYRKPPIRFTVYDRSKLHELSQFASANTIQVLIISIDSFTKDSNVINTEHETGIKPIQYIQSACPIVILDEPQNMETDIRKQAICNLNPCFILRYSATHRSVYNLAFTLNPLQAYELGLVKQIEVDGITADSNYNAAYIHFKKIEQGKTNVKVRLGLYIQENIGVKLKEKTVELGHDLYMVSGKRDIYKGDYVLTEINNGEIIFNNQVRIKLGETIGGLTDEVMKYQIERTVKWHFQKEEALLPLGIKVLTLFFIDKVANYRSYDAEGNPFAGKFARWFEEAFEKHFKLRQAHLFYDRCVPKSYYEASYAHNGYFSQDTKGRVKDTAGETKDDYNTYNLIMRDKERLLSLDEPLRFIFSHSALREGWDNPNVFQICTLNESQSEIKKRQEIGRGLRLPVNHSGERIYDKNINILTVVCNESYEKFTENLQRELEEDNGIKFTGKINNARDREPIKLNQKGLNLEDYPLFFEIWDRIKQKTRYTVEYQTAELIIGAVKILKDPVLSPLTTRPKLKAEKAIVEMDKSGISGRLTDMGIQTTGEVIYLIPDVYGYIQDKVNITRHTIFDILVQSERYHELEINPQMFLDNVVSAIQKSLNALLVDGIKYEKINDKYSEMKLFNDHELEGYLSQLYAVTQKDKTLYNYIRVDSDIERDFARDCEADDRIRFFFKLPNGFKIPTPIGNYIPDWAILFVNDHRIYFVVETKGTTDTAKLRVSENQKIQCGEKHFELFKEQGVAYKWVTNLQEL